MQSETKSGGEQGQRRTRGGSLPAQEESLRRLPSFTRSRRRAPLFSKGGKTLRQRTLSLGVSNGRRGEDAEPLTDRRWRCSRPPRCLSRAQGLSPAFAQRAFFRGCSKRTLFFSFSFSCTWLTSRGGAAAPLRGVTFRGLGGRVGKVF